MKIIQLSAENFKRLVAVEIKPDGNIVVVSGKNGAGKSSVLDAIMAALCGKKHCPTKPIRDDEDRADVTVDLGEYKVRRTFTKGGGGTLKVTNADGMKVDRPQDVLDSLVGKLSFDPMMFSKKEPREQRQMLMGLLGLTFDDLDQEIAENKVNRSMANAEKVRLQHEADMIERVANVPGEEISVSVVAKELSDAVETNAAIDNERQRGVELETGKIDALRDMASLEAQVKQLQTQINAKREYIKSADEQMRIMGDPQKVDVDAIREKLDNIETTNAQIRENQRKKDLLVAVDKQAEIFSALGTRTKALEKAKAARLAKVKMPVKGLSVGDDAVLFDGIPFADVNSAKQLEVGVAISMALNPTLRVLRMDGNGLDAKSLKVIAKMCKDKDYQAWIERVDAGGEVGFVIEDGAIKQ